MTMKIKIQAFVDRGVPKYKVLKIKGVLKKERLPHGYTDSAPSIFLTRGGTTIKLFDGRTLCVGGVYRASTFTKFMEDIEEAGNRLHKMNAQIKEYSEQFEGIRTVQI